MDKIYSRPRIHFRKRKNKTKKQKIKQIIFLIIVIFVILIITFIKAAYPIFMVSCENAASSTAISILNTEVNEIMIMYSYDDLVNVQKDTNGNVSYIEAKIIPINELIAKITNNVQVKIDSASTIPVKINLGSVSGISSLSAISPSFEIALERAGGIETEIKSEFTSVRNKSYQT